MARNAVTDLDEDEPPPPHDGQQQRWIRKRSGIVAADTRGLLLGRKGIGASIGPGLGRPGHQRISYQAEAILPGGPASATFGRSGRAACGDYPPVPGQAPTVSAGAAQAALGQVVVADRGPGAGGVDGDETVFGPDGG